VYGLARPFSPEDIGVVWAQPALGGNFYRQKYFRSVRLSTFSRSTFTDEKPENQQALAEAADPDLMSC
jgi:hypothetical protein